MGGRKTVMETRIAAERFHSALTSPRLKMGRSLQFLSVFSDFTDISLRLTFRCVSAKFCHILLLGKSTSSNFRLLKLSNPAGEGVVDQSSYFMPVFVWL